MNAAGSTYYRNSYALPTWKNRLRGPLPQMLRTLVLDLRSRCLLGSWRLSLPDLALLAPTVSLHPLHSASLVRCCAAVQERKAGLVTRERRRDERRKPVLVNAQARLDLGDDGCTRLLCPRHGRSSRRNNLLQPIIVQERFLANLQRRPTNFSV